MIKKVYSVKTDVWSFGVTCIEVIGISLSSDQRDIENSPSSSSLSSILKDSYEKGAIPRIRCSIVCNSSIRQTVDPCYLYPQRYSPSTQAIDYRSVLLFPYISI